MPDSDEYIERMAKVAKFAAQYGLGLQLSLLTPLEVGKAHAARTGEAGIWMHYREGLRDPKTCAFSVQLWRQRRWMNNKGPFNVEDAGVRVLAIREAPVPGTLYRAVNAEGDHRDQRRHPGRADGEPGAQEQGLDVRARAGLWKGRTGITCWWSRCTARRRWITSVPTRCPFLTALWTNTRRPTYT
ncbi:MAG: hypothetical protein M1541_18715 [Acidobacteria bacterium]|nr:hypothetical protein [Acidobacteriota bacterium]